MQLRLVTVSLDPETEGVLQDRLAFFSITRDGVAVGAITTVPR